MAASLGGAVLADATTEIVSFGLGGRRMQAGIESALGGPQDRADELEDGDDS
jgi:hypothetical protein